MYNDIIRQLLEKIEILPEALLIRYLVRAFPSITPMFAKKAIHSACRSRVGFRKGEFICRTPYLEVDSNVMKKIKAFAVMLDIVKGKCDFVCSQYPWILGFTHNKYYIQICAIEHNMELVRSKLIADKPVTLQERDVVRRIAIVDAGCDISKIKAAGFFYFCTVDDDYRVTIIAKNIDKEGAWKDVPEK